MAGLLHAYVDETGDRGTSQKSSRFFSMAGVVIADENRNQLWDAIKACKSAFGIPATKPLHWKDHIKVYPRRQFVTSQLLAVPNLVVNYVIFEKASIPRDAGLRVDTALFYNYVAGIMLERILLTARDWPGGARTVQVKYGHVRGVDHRATASYLGYKPYIDRWPPWHLRQGSIKFLSSDATLGLQTADQYAGMLSAAMDADQYGGFEPQHLLRIRPQIRRRPGGGSATNWGFKAFVQQGTLQAYPWWPAEGM